MRVRATATLVTFLILACCAARCAPQYTITDLGTLGGNSSEARAINNHGQVTGRSSLTTNGPGYTFLWDPTTGMSNLGALPPTYAESSISDGINDSGDVVGQASGSSGSRAALWSGGGVTQLIPGSFNNHASDINNAGQIVGISYESGYTAFLYDHGTVTNLAALDLLHPDSMAYSINESGQIAGWATTETGDSHAVVWDAGVATDLGTLGGSGSWAHCVSDGGQVVGMSEAANGKWYAFLWQSDVGMTNLGTLPGFGESDAQAVNSSGVAVGRAMGPGNRACLWADGTIYDLNAAIPAGSGWVLEYARDINESGQIVGYGTYNGYQQAFILNPVPEPSGLMLLGCGLAFAFRRRIRPITL